MTTLRQPPQPPQPALPTFELVPGVELRRQAETRAWVAYRPGRQVSRLSPELGDLCQVIARAATPLDECDLMTRAPGGWGPASVTAGLKALLAGGLIRPFDPAAPAVPVPSPRSRRVDFHRPLTVRVTLFDPEILCWLLQPAARLLRGRAAWVVASVGLLLQAAVWAFAPAGPGSGHALPWLVVTLAGVTCLLHELAHGVVLVAADGRPRRLGLMLMYLVPMFFCDVADSFRLPRRAQVEVAFAGVTLQAHLGALLAPLAFAPGPLGASVRAFLAVNLAMALVNLVPFVALDGYFALRAALGVPNLREVALAAWRTAVWCAVVRPSRALRGPRWLTWFGAAAALMPVLMVTWTVSRVLDGWPVGGLVVVVAAGAVIGRRVSGCGGAAPRGRALRRSLVPRSVATGPDPLADYSDFTCQMRSM